MEKMRTEQEMLELICSFAQEDERIRVAAMNGSRTNVNVSQDRFQDYDIVYLVTDMQPFIEDRQWLERFGNRIIMQTPEAMSLFPSSGKRRFAYLMLFDDGNRIDLTVMPVSDLAAYLHGDSLTKILVDKDRQAGGLPEPSDRDYWVKKPSPEYFDDCCNEFWWVSTYIIKGLYRKELLYGAEHLALIRQELLRMLSWQIGIGTDFSVSLGKSYKYMETYLPAETWEGLMKTFRTDTGDHIKEALLECHTLFRAASEQVALRLGFCMPDYGEKVSAYMRA